MTRAVETVGTACRGVHDPYGWCGCCDRPGHYYYGDRILHPRPGPGRGRPLAGRARDLELVLEAIERDHPDGSEFTTWGLRAGLWGARVYRVLRWLEHRGVIARRPTARNTANRWYVRDPR